MSSDEVYDLQLSTVHCFSSVFMMKRKKHFYLGIPASFKSNLHNNMLMLTGALGSSQS